MQQPDTPHVLHYLDVTDEECKARLRQRNASGLHPFSTSDAQFDDITRHFVPPSAAEGFQVVRLDHQHAAGSEISKNQACNPKTILRGFGLPVSPLRNIARL